MTANMFLLVAVLLVHCDVSVANAASTKYPTKQSPGSHPTIIMQHNEQQQNHENHKPRSLNNANIPEAICAIFDPQHDFAKNLEEFAFSKPYEIAFYALHIESLTVIPGSFTWSVYGFNGPRVPPRNVSDPSWVLLDTQADIDFLVPQWPAHPTVFKFDFAAPVKYQYFGFDFGTLSASTTNLVVEVDLCYLI